MNSLDALNEYDLGRSDSLYFRDGSDNCALKQTTTQYCDCGGDFFCVTTEESKPYVQKYEILAPVFISTTWGSEKFFRVKLKSKMLINFAKKEHLNEYLIVSNHPLKLGDIFKVGKECCSKYYIKSKKGRTMLNTFVYNVGRTDGVPLKMEDVNKFNKGTTLNVTGYFANAHNPCCLPVPKKDKPTTFSAGTGTEVMICVVNPERPKDNTIIVCAAPNYDGCPDPIAGGLTVICINPNETTVCVNQ